MNRDYTYLLNQIVQNVCRDMHYSRLITLILVGLCTIVTQDRAYSANEKQVLQDIIIDEQTRYIHIQINLGIPVRHLGHFPLSSGEIVQIQLEFLKDQWIMDRKKSGAPDRLIKLPQAETLLPPINDLVPLSHVTFEGNIPGGPYLTLRFTKPVEFKVNDDVYAIHVLVKKPSLSEKDSKAEDPAILQQKLQKIMAEARRHFAQGEFAVAIQHFKKALTYPNTEFSQEAKELLGVARERKGQKARARLEYKEYLSLYPKGEGADRVRGRLEALNKVHESKKRLKEVTGKSDYNVKTLGRVSQRLYNTGTSNRNVSTLSTYFNISTRIWNKEYDTRGYLSMSDYWNFDDDSRNNTRLSTLYVDFKNKRRGFYAKAGRQTNRNQGVYGRFDGVWMSYEFFPELRFNTSVGRPVNFYASTIIPDAVFFSAAAEMGVFLKYWNSNIFFVEQRASGLVDRRAIGGDLRFSHPAYTVFNFVDFDISYSQLNIYMVRGNWIYSDKYKINAGYNYRRNPILTTTLAVRQEGQTSFDELLDIVSEEQIREKAANHFTSTNIYNVGASYVINKNMQVNADFSVSTVSAQPQLETLTGGIIPQYPGSGPDFNYTLQWMANNLILERDVFVVGATLSDRDNSDSQSFYINNRFTLDTRWYIQPRFMLYNYTHVADKSHRIRYNVSLRTDYDWKKSVKFEMEAGLYYTDYISSDKTGNLQLFGKLGYSWSF